MNTAVPQLRMPAEWEPHDATWIAWPHESSDWPGKLPAVKWVYTEIVRVLAASERVEIIVRDEEQAGEASRMLHAAKADPASWRLHLLPTDRSWLRDSAPTCARSSDGTLTWVRWRFNAWAKYANFELDSAVPEHISRTTGIPLIDAMRPDGAGPLTLEGGGIETDGEGTLLVTEQCLLSTIQERNPGLRREGYERAFAQYLGIGRTIWLDKGVEGDDTHGHIDDIARFTAPGRVVLAFDDDKGSPGFAASAANLERLKAASDVQGRKLEVIKLPHPRRVVCGEDVLPASYANFYIGNSVVLVPTFNDVQDRYVLGLLAELFPGREVIGIHSVDLVLGQGTLHCLSQQQPAQKAL